MEKIITIFIANLLTGKIIDLPFVPDGPITEGLQISFDSQEIRGRSALIYGYSGTGPRTISFAVRLHDDYCYGGIKNKVSAIKALGYPLYRTHVLAPSCYVKIGNFLKFRGILNSIDVSWDRPIRDGYYLIADVSLSFNTIEDYAPGADDVEAGYIG